MALKYGTATPLSLFYKGEEVTVYEHVISGYSVLEYIEFTGTQFIRTGVKLLTAPYSVEITYNKTNDQTADQCLFGQRQLGKFSNIYNHYFESDPLAVSAAGTAPDYVKSTLIVTNTSVTINGTTVVSASSVGNRSTSYEALLGAFSEDSYANAKWFYKGKIFSVKVTSNGTVIRNFVPVRRLSDNAIGMYDTVNGVFYSNAGSGTFGYAERKKYLRSDGSAYIELPYGFSNTDKVEFDFAQDLTEADDKYMIAPSTWNNNNNRFAMGCYPAGRYCAAYGAFSTGDTCMLPATNNDGKHHVWIYDNKVFSIPELSIQRDCNSITWGGTTANLRLFYGYNAPTKGDVYSYRHWKNGTLYFEGVPVTKVGSMGTVTHGIYDRKTDVFYGNSSASGSFSVKNRVNGYPVFGKAYTYTQSAGNHTNIAAYRISSSYYHASLGALSNNTIVYFGDVLKISYTVDSGYEITTHTVNGATFASGTTYEVGGNVSVETQAQSSGPSWHTVSGFSGASVPFGYNATIASGLLRSGVPTRITGYIMLYDSDHPEEEPEGYTSWNGTSLPIDTTIGWTGMYGIWWRVQISLSGTGIYIVSTNGGLYDDYEGYISKIEQYY